MPKSQIISIARLDRLTGPPKTAKLKVKTKPKFLSLPSFYDHEWPSRHGITRHSVGLGMAEQ